MPEKETKHIRKIDILKVFLRSFFLQSVWNYKSLISIGFESCLLPIVKRLYPDIEPRREFLQRHLKFFNCHPYLASYALGVSIRLEEGIAAGSEETTARQLSRVKDLLIPTLGAKGDQLFWLTIRPFSLILGVLGVFIFDAIALKVAALLATFIIYNIPHFYIRYNGLIEGYKFGLDVYKCLTNDRFSRLEKIYLYFGIPVLATFIFLLAWSFFQDEPSRILFFSGAAIYSWMIYKISNNFYYATFFTIIFFLVVSFFFL